jgi:hypothetical protein
LKIHCFFEMLCFFRENIENPLFFRNSMFFPRKHWKSIVFSKFYVFSEKTSKIHCFFEILCFFLKNIENTLFFRNSMFFPKKHWKYIVFSKFYVFFEKTLKIHCFSKFYVFRKFHKNRHFSIFFQFKISKK